MAGPDALADVVSDSKSVIAQDELEHIGAWRVCALHWATQGVPSDNGQVSIQVDEPSKSPQNWQPYIKMFEVDE